MSPATDARAGAGADLVAPLRAGDEAAVSRAAVVPRPALWARLEGSARVTVVSALVNLGITEFWMGRFEDARRHPEEGVAVARRIGRPGIIRIVRWPLILTASTMGP